MNHKGVRSVGFYCLIAMVTGSTSREDQHWKEPAGMSAPRALSLLARRMLLHSRGETAGTIAHESGSDSGIGEKVRQTTLATEDA